MINDNAAHDLSKGVLLAEFGQRLHKLMLRRGWRQAELARHAGLERASISDYVRGRVTPTRASLAKLAEALRVTPDDLLPSADVYENDARSKTGADNFVRMHPTNPALSYVAVNRWMRSDAAIRILTIVQDEPAVTDAG